MIYLLSVVALVLAFRTCFPEAYLAWLVDAAAHLKRWLDRLERRIRVYLRERVRARLTPGEWEQIKHQFIQD